MSLAKTKKSKRRISKRVTERLEKFPTGIEGLDNIMSGGLPRGRPTLVCGTAGTGKTLLGLQVLLGAAMRGEPGVVIAFEETTDDLTKNTASLGFDLRDMIAKKRILVDYIHVDRSEILETGGYDLTALFVRIEDAIKTIGATTVLIDTPEVLFSGFTNMSVMRSELERIFHFLKEQGITSIITGESGPDGHLTRHGLEEYVSDCVIALDQRIVDQITTRRIRVIKYRGSSHGTNEYPFLIGDNGISVLPITGLGLDYPVSTARVATGISALDGMLGEKGYFRGSSVLVSGTAGTGKSSVVSSFAEASCARGERCLYFALEEPRAQVIRNMRSIGLSLAPHVDSGNLRILAARPSVFGLEQHLVAMHHEIERFKPRSVIVDPISSLVSGQNFNEVTSMLTRLFDYLKLKEITGLFTFLSARVEDTSIGVSSLIDTWIELRDVEHAGERNRALYILKSRGMSHSNQVREFLITPKGLDLIDAFIEVDGALIGSARVAREAQLKEDATRRAEDAARHKRQFLRRRSMIEAQISSLRERLAGEEEDFANSTTERDRRASEHHRAREEMKQSKLGASEARRKHP